MPGRSTRSRKYMLRVREACICQPVASLRGLLVCRGWAGSPSTLAVRARRFRLVESLGIARTSARSHGAHLHRWNDMVRIFFSRTFRAAQRKVLQPWSQLTTLLTGYELRTSPASGPKRQAALAGGGFVVEQGVQRWAVAGFWLQWVHVLATSCCTATDELPDDRCASRGRGRLVYITDGGLRGCPMLWPNRKQRQGLWPAGASGRSRLSNGGPSLVSGCSGCRRTLLRGWRGGPALVSALTTSTPTPAHLRAQHDEVLRPVECCNSRGWTSAGKRRASSKRVRPSLWGTSKKRRQARQTMTPAAKDHECEDNQPALAGTSARAAARNTCVS